MERKAVASFMAIVLCALMVLPQVGLAVRDTATDPRTVTDQLSESNAQQTLEVQESDDQGNSVPAEGEEESVADTSALTEQEDSSSDTAASSEGIGEAEEIGTDASTPELGESSDDSDAQGEEWGEDAPEDDPTDSQATDAPVIEATPETVQEPAVGEKPESGEYPTEEDGAGYTLSDVEAIIESGISLADLQELMQVSVDSGKVVSENNFRFLITNSIGEAVKSYDNFDKLRAEHPGLDWSGTVGGRVNGAMFPLIDDKAFENLYLRGTIIEALGVVTVTVSDGDAPATEKNYIWFSASASADGTSAMVLPTSEEGKNLFEVRYVPADYSIDYEVCLNGQDASPKYPLDTIFGVGRASRTKDGTATVSVSIPAGFTGQVYIGDKDGELQEQYPVGAQSYGEYPLGTELAYAQSETGATVDSQRGPGYYATTGTYQVGSEEDPASAPQLVRVVLEAKESYVFDPEFWLSTPYTGYGERIEDGKTMKSVELTKDTAQPRTDVQYKRNDDGTYDLIWTFTTVASAGKPTAWALDALEINGAALKIPYVDYSSNKKQQVAAWTTLPSGIKIYFVAECNPVGKTTIYHLTVMNVTHNIVITGGNLHDAAGASELVLEDSTGTEVQFFFCTPDGKDGKWGQAVQSKPVTVSKEGSAFHYDAGDPEHNYTNVRFKLKPGYEWKYGHAGAGSVAFYNKEDTKVPWGITENNEVYEDDGWYYIRLGTGDSYYSRELEIRRLSITAEPVRYVIQYLDGRSGAINSEVTFSAGGIQNMPTFQDGDQIDGTWTNKNGKTLDGNHGSYYSTVEKTGALANTRISDVVSIYSSVPEEAAEARPARFLGWVVTNANGVPLKRDGTEATADSEYMTYAPSAIMSMEDVKACGTLYDKIDPLYVIYLTARWANIAPSYTYYVTFNTKNYAGVESCRVHVEGIGRQFDETDIAAGRNAGVEYGENEWYVSRNDNYFRVQEDDPQPKGLNVIFGPDGERARTLRSGALQWYKYDVGKNSNEHPGQFLWSSIPNGGEVDVWLVSNLGKLSISKTVNSEKQEELGKAFLFTVTFVLPEDDPGTQGDESAYFGSPDGNYSIAYTLDDGEELTIPLERTPGTAKYIGTLSLKTGQVASFVLPAGTDYSITENVDEGKYRIEKSGDTGRIAAASPGVTARFTNTPSGITAEKTQVEVPDPASTEEISTPSDFITIGSGDHVKYSIRVINRDENRPVTVTVTDEIPNAQGDDGRRLKLTVNGDSVSGDGEYTPGSDTAGTVRWENVTIDPGETEIFTFTVTTPVVNNLNTYINAAKVDYRYEDDPSGQLTTNDASLVVVKDWLRIGKVLPRGSRGVAGDRDFVFHIALSDSAGEASYHYIGLAAESYEGQGITVPKSGMLQFKNGTAEVCLKEGQAIALYGIPDGTEYTVVEERVEGFRTSVVKQSTKEETRGGSTSGVIHADASDWLIFKNTPIGVRLSKIQTVVRTGASDSVVSVLPGDTVEYVIRVKNIDTLDLAENVTVTDIVPDGMNVGTISNDGRQEGRSITWTIPKLEPGGATAVSFTAVVPQDASEENYVNVANAFLEGAARAASDPVTATIQTGSLSIAKTVEGGPMPSEDAFNFIVELARGSDGAPLTDGYPYASDDGRISGTVANGNTIMLKGGDAIVIRDLPVGTRWTITETGPFEWDDHGYEGQAILSGTLTVEEPSGKAAFSNMWHALYRLTYDGNGNTSGVPPADGSRYREGEAVALQQPAPDFQREKAVFLGWSEMKSDLLLTSREAADDVQIVEEVEFLGSDVTVFAVWGADADGDGVPDYEETVGPSGTPGPGDTPEPDETPEPTISPGPDSTLPPGVTSEPFFSPQPGAADDTGSGAGGDRVPDTGDNTQVGFWNAFMAACVIGSAVAWTQLRRRRSK